MKTIKQLAILAASLITALCSLIPCYALDWLDKDHPVSLSIDYRIDGIVMSDVTFEIYKVADAIDTGTYQLDEEFAGLGIEIPQTNDLESWQNTAAALYGAAVKNQISPSYEARTNSQGIVHFYSIPQGLYLISPTSIRKNDTIYHSSPYMISLPDRKENGTWNYEVISYPKGISTQNVVDLTVQKTWDPSLTPIAITVELFRDDELYESVVLNDENNWTYIFKNLDNNHIWSLAEKNVPADCKVEIQEENNVRTISNKALQSPSPSITIPNTSSRILAGLGILTAGVMMAAAAGIVYLRHKNHE